MQPNIDNRRFSRRRRQIDNIRPFARACRRRQTALPRKRIALHKARKKSAKSGGFIVARANPSAGKAPSRNSAPTPNNRAARGLIQFENQMKPRAILLVQLHIESERRRRARARGLPPQLRALTLAPLTIFSIERIAPARLLSSPFGQRSEIIGVTVAKRRDSRPNAAANPRRADIRAVARTAKRTVEAKIARQQSAIDRRLRRQPTIARGFRANESHAQKPSVRVRMADIRQRQNRQLRRRRAVGLRRAAGNKLFVFLSAAPMSALCNSLAKA